MAKKETPNRIAELRKAKGLTQAQLADLLGIHWVTLSKLERGKIQLHVGWMDAIAEALGVEPFDIISERPDTREITINGSIGEAGRFTNFVDDDNNYEEFEIDITIQPIGGDFGSWVLIEGEASWPIFHDGDKLHFTPADSRDVEKFGGRYAIVSENGADFFAGYIIVTSRKDAIDLQIINGKVLRDLKVQDIAILTEVRFAWPSEHITFPKLD